MPATHQSTKTVSRKLRTGRRLLVRARVVKPKTTKQTALIERLRVKANEADEGKTVDLTGLDSEELRASLFGG